MGMEGFKGKEKPMHPQRKGPPAHVRKVLESGDPRAIRDMQLRAAERAAETRKKNAAIREAAAKADAIENEVYESAVEDRREEEMLSAVLAEKLATGELLIDPLKGDIIQAD